MTTDSNELASQADALIEDEDWEEVLQLLDGRREPALVTLRVQALVELEEFESALEELDEMGLTPDEPGESADPWTLRGLASFYLDETDQARDAFDIARRVEPMDIPSLHGRALLYRDLGFEKAAELDMLKALDIARSEESGLSLQERRNYEGQTWDLLAGIALEDERLDEAEKALRAAHKADPDEASYPLDLARLLSLDGRPEEGRVLAAKAAELDELMIEAHLLASQLQALTGDVDAALETARACLALDEEEPFSWIQISAVQAMKNDFDASRESARKAIELDPELADGYQLEAAALQATGRGAEINEAHREQMGFQADLPSFLYGERFDPYGGVQDMMSELANMDPAQLRGLAQEVMNSGLVPPGMQPMMEAAMEQLPALLKQMAGENPSEE